MPSKALLVALSLLFIAAAANIPLRDTSDDVCHCECCYQGGCCVLQGSFLVKRCANCTIASCEGLYPCPGEARMIKRTQCTDRNSPGKVVLYFLFLSTLLLLVVAGCAKEHLPPFRASPRGAG
eukprot:GGOE01001876.1.p2 GENE.GGOE01001876.1~~GGOE01001876.1.p2  ORF type:complete len:123 (-),score=29.83 GGOE01001876.1:288-656(-)